MHLAPEVLNEQGKIIKENNSQIMSHTSLDCKIQMSFRVSQKKKRMMALDDRIALLSVYDLQQNLHLKNFNRKYILERVRSRTLFRITL